MVDVARRAVIDRIKLPHVVEGLAIAPDGATLYVCAQTAAEFYVIDANSATPCPPSRSTAPTRRESRCGACASHPTDMLWCPPTRTLTRRSMRPTDSKQIASFPTRKAPMGFGFAADSRHAYLCCHDDAEVLEFELATGRMTRTFHTAAGCEFIIAYH